MPAPKKVSKPDKPQDCPLFAHNNGQWCKKVRGRLRYFGPWSDLNAALQEYYRQKPYLEADRLPPPPGDDLGLTLKDVANKWLDFQSKRVDAGDLRPRTWTEYKAGAGAALQTLGSHIPVETIKPEDFGPLRAEFAARYGYDGLMKYIKIVRMMLRWAYNNDLIDRPVKFGDYFSLPGQRKKKEARRQKKDDGGERLFTAGQILDQLKKASDQLRAMILLGINGGFGNTDCAQLVIEAVDLKQGIIDYARSKTQEDRLVPLWPETLKALKAIIGDRKEGLVFVTRWGNPWVREDVTYEQGQITKLVRFDAIADMFNKILEELGQKRKGVGFYALRHTLRTVAAELKDENAIRWIMGHVRDDTDAEYIERLPVDRLRAVTDHVRKWLYKSHKPGKKSRATST